jgi:outer membrane protein OmpA-like peptidoglycan-associated protein
MTRSRVLGAIILCFIANGAGVQAADHQRDLVAADQWRCEPSDKSAKYISVDDLDRLRRMSMETPETIAFSQLSFENGAVITEALRIGPAGAFSAARVLRDLAIIQALDQQARCESGKCGKDAIIAQFKTASQTDPQREWGEIRDRWIKFRDADASAAQNCLETWRTRPAAPRITLADVSLGKLLPEKPGEGPTNNARRPPKEASLASELIGLNPAEIRFCQVRSTDAQDKSEVSDEQVRQLRDDYRRGDVTILADMNLKYREPLEEALRVGPRAGYFAHRVLRNLIIIKELQRQVTCSARKLCSPSDDIRALKRNDSWPETLALWKSARDTDLQRSLACMKYSKTLPTLELAPVVVASTEVVKRGDHAVCNTDSARDPIMVYFAKNQAVIAGAQLAKLATAAALMKECPSLRASVAGYTDQDGRRRFNMRLSRARAAAVAAYLVEGGVKSGQIETHGYGVARWLSARATRQSKAHDRRAEIRIRKMVESNDEDCLSRTDGCVNCVRSKPGENFTCSNIGIACQPGSVQCVKRYGNAPK